MTLSTDEMESLFRGETVAASSAADIGWVVLGKTRPHVLTEEFPGELIAALDALRRRNVKVVVLAGSTKVFCAGADIRLAGRLRDPEFGRRWLKAQHSAVSALVKFERPTVAAVHGAAAGGGCNLAIACDFTIAGENASFSQAFIGIGLATDMGSLYLLPRRVGAQRARQLMLTGTALSAREALMIGLVDEMVGADRLYARATELAEQLATRPTLAYQTIKAGMADSDGLTLDESLRLEAELQVPILQSDDFREGTDAFLEKRLARFSGK